MNALRVILDEIRSVEQGFSLHFFRKNEAKKRHFASVRAMLSMCCFAILHIFASVRQVLSDKNDFNG